MNGEKGLVDKNPFCLHGDCNSVSDTFDHCRIEFFTFKDCRILVRLIASRGVENGMLGPTTSITAHLATPFIFNVTPQ
jgi:hypothetical protein